MLGKSFLIGLLFAGLSAGVVYFGVGESLDGRGSGNAVSAETPQKKKLKEILGKIDLKSFKKDEVSKQGDKTSDEKLTTITSPDENTNTVTVLVVKSDRELLDDAKMAANAGLYLDSADMIAEIQSPIMRDTARSNLALALAKDGEKDFAMAVIEDVETQALAEIMRKQVNQALPQ